MSTSLIPLPTLRSLQTRERVAEIVSSLRRVRPRVPFWELLAHRTPTLSLYRSLLRESPCENIRRRVQAIFRKNRHLTGTARTKVQLTRCYKLLDAFHAAYAGDVRMQQVLLRYDRLLQARAENVHMRQLEQEQLAWQCRLRNRPILTGSFLRASLANKPLPRMKHQPLAITMMIKKRRFKREARYAQVSVIDDWLDDLEHERTFERELYEIVGSQFQPIYDGFDWDAPLWDLHHSIHETFKRDIERSRTPISDELRDVVKAARREKIANKTRQRARERAGVVTSQIRTRLRNGPPAHILCKMTPAQRHADKVVRSISEVGYVAMMKKRLGFKLRDPERWKIENGRDEDNERLSQEVQKVEAENLRRRRLAEKRERENGPP